MKSLPTISPTQYQREKENNETKFMELLKTCDPALYNIRICLMESGVNPLILLKVIRALHNIGTGTGHGVIHIEISYGKVTNIKPIENDKVEQQIIQVREEVRIG